MQPETTHPTPCDASQSSRQAVSRTVYHEWLTACNYKLLAHDTQTAINLRKTARRRNLFGLKLIAVLAVSFVVLGAAIGLIVGINLLPSSVGPESFWGNMWSVTYPTLLGFIAGCFAALLFIAATVGIYHHWWEELSHIDDEIRRLEARQKYALEKADQHLACGKNTELAYARERGIPIDLAD